MGLTVLPAKEKDVSWIAALWEAGWHEAHAQIVPDELRRLRTHESFLDRAILNLSGTRVIFSGKELAGFCMVKADELYQLYVSPNARGSGAAKTMIADAEHRIRSAGYNRAWLACAIGNDRAARFYEKAGWHNSGRRTVQLDTSDGVFPLEVWQFDRPLVAQDA